MTSVELEKIEVEALIQIINATTFKGCDIKLAYEILKKLESANQE